MAETKITKEVFDFLKQLENNNNRDWFNAHKKQFTRLNDGVKEVFTAVAEKMKQHDEIEKLKFFRIYRDVRFSKNKSPYKTNLGASMSRAGAHRRGGYYMHIQPNQNFIAAGFWAPSKEDLFRIRKEWEVDSTDLRELMNKKKFKDTWGDLVGEELKTAPKGFDKEHPNIDLIRRKQFIFTKQLSDKEVMSPDFATTLSDAFKTIRPYFDLMSNVLTTNLNGESLLD